LDYLFGVGSYAGRDTRVQPALNLLDLNLPKIDGFGVLRRVREDEKTAFLPVVILTSSKQDEDLLRGFGLRAESFIQKPLNSMQFMAVVQQLGLYWLLLNEPPSSNAGTPT